MAECESCGTPDDDLAEVHRIYVRADSWREVDDAVADDRVTVLDDVEHWCFACRSQYPHRPAG